MTLVQIPGKLFLHQDENVFFLSATLLPVSKTLREFVYGPKVRRGQVILSGLDLAFTKYLTGNCEQDPWPTKY